MRIRPERMAAIVDAMADASAFIREDVPALVDEVKKLNQTVEAQDRQITARTGKTAAERLLEQTITDQQDKLNAIHTILGDPYPPQAKLDEIRKVLDGEHPDTD